MVIKSKMSYLGERMEISTKELVDTKRYDEANEVWFAARSQSATPEFLSSLFDSPIWFIRSAVGGNKNTPGHILAKLSSDQNATVRWKVGNNDATPPEILRRLAVDEDWDVRYAVAGNPSTPIDALAGLAKDEVIHVKFALVANKSTTKEILQELAKDSNNNLSALAKAALGIAAPPAKQKATK